MSYFITYDRYPCIDYVLAIYENVQMTIDLQQLNTGATSGTVGYSLLALNGYNICYGEVTWNFALTAQDRGHLDKLKV